VNLMSWMLNVDTDSDLKSNAKRELKIDMPSYTDTIGQKIDNINWNKVDFYKYAEYGAKDAYATYMLRDIFLNRVKEQPALLKCYKSLELPLIYEVARSEMAGIQIDVPYLHKLAEKLAIKIKEVEESIYDTVGVSFNIGSSKQLAEILFDRLGYPVIKTSEKTGARSCDEDTLKELSFKGYEVADMILDYRQYEKIRNTYCDKLPKMVDGDGRLRGNFNQSGTATGRFSSSAPNLQNIVNSKEFPVKKAFIAKKGYVLLNVDWSTIEIRIMAHESGDKTLIKFLNDGRDIHQETADSINSQFGLTLSRGQGKTINFGVLYLMGAESLAYMLNKELKNQLKSGKITDIEYKKNFITKQTAQNIIDGYFNTYVGFKEFVTNETRESQKSGWVWTMGGRKRPVFELNNKKTFGVGQRKTVNTIIQGGAGDLMKLAIMRLQRMYVENNYDATTLLYIHDEYVIEVKENQAEKCLKDVIDLMQNIFPKSSVPILCEGGIFDNWAGLKEGAIREKKKQQVTIPKLLQLNLLNNGIRK